MVQARVCVLRFGEALDELVYAVSHPPRPGVPRSRWTVRANVSLAQQVPNRGKSHSKPVLHIGFCGGRDPMGPKRAEENVGSLDGLLSSIAGDQTVQSGLPVRIVG